MQDGILDGLLGMTWPPGFNFLHEMIELCTSDNPDVNRRINGRNHIGDHLVPSCERETSRSVVIGLWSLYAIQSLNEPVTTFLIASGRDTKV